MRPSRMHHHASVSRDLEATRRFYEEILGLPLVATWCEGGLEGDGSNPFCHTFFELEDGSCLAFFHFADPETTEAHARLASTSPFDHVALTATPEIQSAVEERAKKAGLETRVIDHGYCRSLYVNDPDGLLVELTVDAAWAEESAGPRRASARRDLDRWIAGDHRIGNHTQTHSIELGTTDDPRVAATEIGRAQEALGDLGEPERWFRPYGGGGIIGPNLLSRHALDYLCGGGYSVVLWNSVPRDWENPDGWPERPVDDIVAGES